MKRALRVALVLAAILAAGIAGYVGRGYTPDLAALRGATTPASQASVPSGPVIYYRDPDGRPAYSAKAKTTEDGRPFRAVHASEDVSFTPQPAPQASVKSDRRVLYYRNPMGLPDVSSVPKKDSMGMDYIAVYEGEDEDGDTIRISPAKIQRIGVTTEKVKARALAPLVRAPGTIQLDERQIAVISLRAEAFVESVENITTGSEVRKGQKLMRIYSPAISAAAAELAGIVSGRAEAGNQGSRQKLRNFVVPEEVIAEIERTRRAPIVFTWTSPRDGVVLERNVVEGMRVNPGDVLFRIADHSSVWALVDVPEAQLASVAQGQTAIVRARAYPDRTFTGKVALVYPHLNAQTRSVRVRIELPNPDFALLPDMYVMAEIDTGSGKPVLSVPESAVIDSGDRQIVILDKGEGRFEPRAVRLGARGGDYVELRDGVKEGDVVVTSANFLIDADSNLKAALKGLTGGSASQ